MAGRVNAVWLQPVTTDPTLLVNRKAELDDLVGRLEEFRVMQKREAHFLISGARGVGKSIFTRAAIRRFAHMHPDQIIDIVVDSRGLRYRPFLNKLARYLVDAVMPHAEKGKRRDLQLWLEQLALMANQSQITRAQTETVGRRYGADATIGADLLVKLQSRLSWEETRSLGVTQQTTLTITDDLLHAAITATLERLAQADSRWTVVIFFDDLDQAILDHESDVATVFRQVVDLRPCLSLVHFRTESLVENVKREANEQIYLQPLEPDVLFEIVKRRLDAATEEVRKQFPSSSDWEAIRKLSHITGNPLVFLKWAHGLLRTQDWPPPVSWTDSAQLARLVFTADPLNGVELELARRLVEIVDRCDGGQPDKGIQREDLERGSLSTDLHPPARGLSAHEIDDLIKLQVLLPKRRYEASQGFCIQPVLNLLRPSVRAKL